MEGSLLKIRIPIAIYENILLQRNRILEKSHFEGETPKKKYF
jgi:hypothetical protein